MSLHPNGIAAIESINEADEMFIVAIEAARRVLNSCERQPMDADQLVNLATAYMDLAYLINQRQVDWPEVDE